jgi:MFS superfamily sulfate permease-like transporter
LHIARGAELKNLFKVDATVTNIDSDHYTVALNSAAVFSNYLSLGDILDKLPRHKTIVVDLSKSRLVDHSVMEHLSHYEREYVHDGGIFEVMGLQKHKRGSVHPLSSAHLSPANK